MKKYLNDFLNQIEDRREMQNISCRALSEKALKSTSSYYQMLDGERVPSLKSLERLAEAVGKELVITLK